MIAQPRTWTVGWWVACITSDPKGYITYHRWVERKRFKGRRIAEAYVSQEKILGVRYPPTLIARRLDDLTTQPPTTITDHWPAHQYIGEDA